MRDIHQLDRPAVVYTNSPHIGQTAQDACLTLLWRQCGPQIVMEHGVTFSITSPQECSMWLCQLEQWETNINVAFTTWDRYTPPPGRIEWISIYHWVMREIQWIHQHGSRLAICSSILNTSNRQKQYIHRGMPHFFMQAILVILCEDQFNWAS